MQRYRSTLSASLWIPVTLIIGSVLAFFICTGIYILVFFILLIALFVVHMFATTGYIIDGEDLKIHCGFFYNRSIPIRSITKMLEVTGLENAPALSFKRLQITFGHSETVSVSPKDKKQFTEELVRLNPAIQTA